MASNHPLLEQFVPSADEPFDAVRAAHLLNRAGFGGTAQEIARVQSIASLSLALPGLERCERPNSAPSSASRFHPGRFLVGSDENRASAGRTPGGGMRVIDVLPSLQMSVRRWERMARCEG